MVIGWVLAVATIVLFAWLGRWQLDRMHEKQAKLDAAVQALKPQSVQPLLLASSTARAQAYDWAMGSGAMANATLWLDNQIQDGKPGLRMYCVLLPDDGVQALLLDAGWWPLDGKRDMPVFGCPVGRAQLVRGLLAPPPSSGLLHGDAMAASGPHRWLATRIDPVAIAGELKLSAGISPRVLRLDPARNKDDAGVMLVPGVRDLVILPNTLTPARHLGYAVQWFALAFTVLVVAVVLTLKAWKSR
ncbi:SURF1 family protein [Thermomonas sp.]|uniref:SURF1 family protein n=1 Tax=Thermomonas sp. TaxID=1971895 RepID=UPI0024877CBD|nr:SURF1 family protein [Thermomonas sp.]MDI1252751.1 SURF1 family protein [Thermomonas sp.]